MGSTLGDGRARVDEPPCLLVVTSIADASTAGNPVRQPLQVVFSPVMNNISSPHISPSVVSNQTASPNSGAWGGSTSSAPRFSEPVSRLIGRSRCSPGDRNLRQASLFETKAFYDRERMNSAPTEDYLVNRRFLENWHIGTNGVRTLMHMVA